ncbi:MAG TPA: lysylphosphatidylglycerol synthase transmembrane domain-containing protein [bacterium]|nr:lysylphosphatidylglycerol synthase transmembrane domain-containing protein [bacterium]
MSRTRFLKDPKFYLGLFVSAFFLFIAFFKVSFSPLAVTAKIDFSQMGQAIVTANPLYLVVIMAQVLGMLFIRGHRWTLFLKPIKKTNWISLGWSTCIGFAVNNLLPARLGEVARSISAGRKEGIGFGAVFGSVVVERIYDTLSILVLFVLSLFVWEFSGPMEKLAAATKSEFGVEISQQSIALNLSILVGLILAAIIFLKWKTEFSLRVARLFLTPLPVAWRDKIVNGLRNFINGLTQTKNPLEAAWVVVLSASIWVISALTVWLGLAACHVDASMTDAIFVLMTMVVAVSVPASPGYIGTYHYLCATGIVLSTDSTWDQAMGTAIVIHLSNYLPQTLAGLYALAREGLSLREIEEKPAEIESV